MARGPVREYGLNPPDPVPGIRWVDCGNAVYAQVDEESWDLVRGFQWSVKDNGEPAAQYSAGDGGYTSVHLKARILMTRAKAGEAIRNLNGDPLDCRRSNIKLMSLTESRALSKKLDEEAGIVRKRAPRRNLNAPLKPRSQTSRRRSSAAGSVLKGLGEKD